MESYFLFGRGAALSEDTIFLRSIKCSIVIKSHFINFFHWWIFYQFSFLVWELLDIWYLYSRVLRRVKIIRIWRSCHFHIFILLIPIRFVKIILVVNLVSLRHYHDWIANKLILLKVNLSLSSDIYFILNVQGDNKQLFHYK